MSENQFVVRVVSLALPRYSLSDVPQPPLMKPPPDESFSNLKAALDYARGLVGRYGVEINGPDGLHFDRTQVVNALNSPSS
jgi:hypothetical protein